MSVEPGTPQTRRLHAVSAFLRTRSALLLPLAAHFRASQAVFESTIHGSSMTPAIPTGARFRVQLRDQQFCGLGDVVFYQTSTGYMVHRVVYRTRRGPSQAYVLTCGDNCLAPDPPVPHESILGIVSAVELAGTWQPPVPPRITSGVKRAIRACTVTTMIAALWCHVATARRLSCLLLACESRARLLVGYVRWHGRRP